ncbi:MAG TPA: hypothetical protein VK975_05355 [Acidimicrobiales bacterium]|nr:hypothetical protein [Acidimicrobiales bacterium]
MVGVAGAELEAMQRISRGERARRLAAASLVLTGAASFLTGTVFGGASLAAPSAVLELDADVRSDGATDWAHAGGATGSGGVFEGGTFVDDTTPPAPPALTAALAADATVLASGFTVDPLSSDDSTCGTGDPTVLRAPGARRTATAWTA